MIYRLGELFCGPGGIAWGATHADIGNPDFALFINGPTIMMKARATRTDGISVLINREPFTMQISANLI